MGRWLCHQLGSREHYSIPRALHAKDRLGLLQVDAWIRTHWQTLLSWMQQGSLAGRYHEDLSDAWVRSLTPGRLRFDVLSKARGLTGWTSTLKRNEWFQKSCVSLLREELERGERRETIVFSYSYAAKEIFEEAKAHGSICVLGQIDPGPEEFRWVAEQVAKTGGKSEPEPPSEYWNLWREEVRLADRIVVNSDWSMELLCRSGVPAEKMRVIPLAYEIPMEVSGRNYPLAWSQQRPMRMLFLGQLIPRKGVYPLFEAIRVLSSANVSFDLAGPIGVEIPDWILENDKVTIHGPVSQPTAEALYLAADVFVLPTFSDGFAITQLEAVAHGLPLIVSRHCGQVVTDGVNGIVLPDVSSREIVAAIQRMLDDPAWVGELASHRPDMNEYSIAELGRRLVELEAEMVAERGSKSVVSGVQSRR